MHKLVFDTSALISLEVANLVNKASETFHVFIPNKVHEELKGVAKYEDIHGKAANRILKICGKMSLRRGNNKSGGGVEIH